MTLKRQNILTFLFCLLLAAGICVETAGYPQAKGQGFGAGPEFYPRVLAVSLLILGGLSLLQGLRPAALPQASPSEASPARYRLVAEVFALCVFCFAIMPYAGFLVSGFILILAMILLIRRTAGWRRFGQDALLSIGILAAIFVVFEVIIKIELPRSIFTG